jgi:MoxR-like ATPase
MPWSTGSRRPEVPAPLAEVTELAKRVLDEVERAVVGKRDAIELVLAGILADGHVLVEDFPGLAKTLIARSFAQVLSLDFARIQFTPDLMPSDVTGSSVYNQRSGDFEFRPGPVFTNLVLADEINRAPPKTQAALLEAMQERQVTTEGRTRPLGPPFLVLATQNPIEYEGTYPLPEAQLDRFLLRAGIGYPSRDDEWGMLARRLERRADELTLDPVAGRADLLAAQRAVEEVYLHESVGRYVVDLVAATRANPRVRVGASPRGTIAVAKLARVRAVLAGRDFVTPDDVKAVAAPALGHRLVLRPELWAQRVRGDDVVAECLAQVPTPPTGDLGPDHQPAPGAGGQAVAGEPARRPG